MQDIVLIGSGGCMREIVWQMQEQNKQENTWNIQGYVDVAPLHEDGHLVVGSQRIPYLGDDEWLLQRTNLTNAVICVGNPALRRKIAQKLQKNPQIQFPNIILGRTEICEDVEMEEGCIISVDARISTNVKLGKFVFLNIGSMVCHDGRLGDYVTLSPDVKLAGNVVIGAGSELGIGAKVIQGINISENVVVGAGSVVIRNINADSTVAGVPAKKIRG